MLRGYQGTLEDTELFPEGGGQVGAQRVPGDAFLREGDRYVLRGYQLMLEDTELFPEGGGQVWCSEGTRGGYQLTLEDTELFPEGRIHVGAQRVPGDAGVQSAVS